MQETKGRRGRTKDKTLTDAEFDRLVPLLKAIDPDRIEAARLVMVPSGGDPTFVEIAKRYNVSRQAVQNTVKRIWKTYEDWQEAEARNAHLPEGWEHIAVPPELVHQVRELIKADYKVKK